MQLIYPSCLANIQIKMEILTETEKKVAAYILENQRKILEYTVSELAEQSGVSDATVIRFCKKVGFDGYQEFKISLAQDTILPYKQLYYDLEKGDSISEIIKKVISAEIEVLQETQSTLNDSLIQKTADAILKANRCVIVGSGGSTLIGQDFMHKLLKIGVNCSVQSDADIQAMEASLMVPGDVLIGISHSGANKNVIECMKIARGNGVLTIGLTSSHKAPIQKQSDLLIVAPSKRTVFHSESATARIAQLAVLDVIVASISLADYEKAYGAIQKTRAATANRKF